MANVFVMRNGQKVPHFSQGDAQWSGRTLGVSSTISAKGCAITSIAMFLKYYGRDVSPQSLDQYLDDNQGYSGNSVVFATALKHKESQTLKIAYGGKITSNFESTINDRIDKNIPTVARVDYGSDADEDYNHFVVIVGKTSDGDYIMNDPATSQGNGAANPTDANVIGKTTRKNGYTLVGIDVFTVTETVSENTSDSPSSASESNEDSEEKTDSTKEETTNEKGNAAAGSSSGDSAGALHFKLPVKLTSDYTLTNESLQNFFSHTEKEYKGGYFPLGANTVWHGGLHIHTANGSDVVSIADGMIVGAKLADENDKANGHYGSHNFILVKHEISGNELNSQFSTSQNAKSSGNSETHTVKSGEKLEDLATKWGTTIQKIRDANPALESHFGQNDSKTVSWYQADDVVKRPGEATSEGQKTTFSPSEKKVFYSLYMHLNAEPLDAENNAKLKEFTWLLKSDGSSVNGKDSHTVVSGEKLEDLAKEWNTTVKNIRNANPALESNFGTNKSGTVSWYNPGDVVKRPNKTNNTKTIDAELLNKLKAGEIVKIENTAVHAGDLLWTSGKYGTKPTGMIHWEIFSEENLTPSFTTIEDPDEDCNMDSSTIFSMVDQDNSLFNDKTNLDADEVINFYLKNEKSQSLRMYCCKFLSEWAIDPDVAIKKMKGKFITTGLKEKLLPYYWWKSAVSKGVDLPGSTHVWHYNPITFLKIFGNVSQSQSAPVAAKSTSASKIPEPTDNVHTDWKLGFNRDISKQNEYNDHIYKYTKDTTVNPYIFKSLIAQESAFKKDAHNKHGYAGLTQIGFKIVKDADLKATGTKQVEKKVGDKVVKQWEYDLVNDERFNPEKSIEGGVKVLKKKISSINQKVFKNYTKELPDEEKWKFYLAAYNGGEGTIKKAYDACHVVNATWYDVIKGKETSALWSVIPESWGPAGKYKEISTYPLEILKRAMQDDSVTSDSSGSNTASATPPVAESATASKVDSLKKGDYDDVAVKKYSSKKASGKGHVSGNQIETLQKNLATVGLTEIGTVDGDYGDKTEQCVKKFQEYALKESRYTSDSCISAPITFKGKADGIADKATVDELALWLTKGYKISVDKNTNSASNEDPQWIVNAKKEIGVKEISGAKDNDRIIEYHSTTTLKATDDETAWCSAFVNWCFKQASIKGTNSAGALSWEKWGKSYDKPAYGSVAVIAYYDEGSTKRNGSGHVGFVVGKQGSKIVVLGGNQGDMVKVSAYNPSAINVKRKAPKKNMVGKVVAYVLPADQTANFNLPEATGKIEELGNTR